MPSLLMAKKDGWGRAGGRRSATPKRGKAPGRTGTMLIERFDFAAVSAASRMEARAGIEPTYTDLQSAASPLCHRAILASGTP
ncbi:protein of unknown function [Azospirillum baldaniorum]|uniref:Uncharacterized protein n=1 Tax=Azospirillum baldaniorum TaxID=1064539 RepID=A0A9P1NM06_9PROT|nr:protein of unknown function [Azospirillum baldaniorum]